MEVKQSDGREYLERISCNSWAPAQSPVFDLCMIAFFVAYVFPQTFKHYALALRVSMLAAILLYLTWGAVYWCTWDLIGWVGVFLLQNVSQLVFIAYKMHKTRFDADMENLYIQVFEPFGISRDDFQALTQHHCQVVRVHAGDKYAVERCASIDDRLSLLVSGRMRVMYNGEYLHDIRETQIIDGVEWEGCKTKRGELFQVSIEAVDRCLYLCWNKEKLSYYLEANPQLQNAIQYIRGNDVLTKIRQTAVNHHRRNLKNVSRYDEIENIDVTKIVRSFAEEDPKYLKN